MARGDRQSSNPAKKTTHSGTGEKETHYMNVVGKIFSRTWFYHILIFDFVVILVNIINKLTDQNYKFHCERPTRDIHIFKIDNSNGILHEIARRVVLEGTYFYMSH